MLDAVKVALDPSPRQVRMLESHAGAARFAFNAGLAHVKEALDAGEACDWSYYSLRRWWNSEKDSIAVRADGTPWWQENSKEAYNHGLRCLADALGNFSASRKGQRKGRQAGFPGFRSKERAQARFSYTTGSFGTIEGDPRALRLPRIGRVHCFEDVARRVGGAKVVRMNVSRDGGRWHAVLTVERGEARRPAPDGPPVGVDLGLKALAVCSDGTVFEGTVAYRKGEARLARLQRSMSRKQKGSRRRRRARERVSRQHARIAAQRSDRLHKMTSELAYGHSLVAIEDLNVRGMMANSRLAKSLGDAAFGEVRRQLEYKCARSGARLVVIGRFYPSSKRCCECGAVKAKLALSERTYRCGECGNVLDRDLNAARNILVAASAAETLNAHGADVRPCLYEGADRGEVRTKRPAGVRLGAGPGNGAVQTKTN